METHHALPEVFRFGPFELNISAGELRKRGIRLSLQEQPLLILSALLEQPGQVVSRQDLCRRLWPNGTFVDFEHSLNAAVRRLRVTLGDEAETPRFIETVHRRGYRFLAWSQGTPVHTSSLGFRLRPERQRLAVLPFVVLPREGGSDLFSDGLTEETIIQLTRACPPQIGVLSRMSTASALCQGASETGRALGADFLVEGSIRREGDRVRIVAQLIEAQDETHMWAASFDRVLGDALTLQVEVAEQIARAVAGAISARVPLPFREAAS